MSKFKCLQMSCNFKLLSIFTDLIFPIDPDSSVTELWLKYFLRKSFLKQLTFPFLAFCTASECTYPVITFGCIYSRSFALLCFPYMSKEG